MLNHTSSEPSIYDPQHPLPNRLFKIIPSVDTGTQIDESV